MSDNIIDFHTHAFPDAVADRAMAQLLSETDQVQSFLDGKLSSLIASMDDHSIETSVLCSIATKPSQFEPILNWSRQICSDRIIPLASVHPKDPNPVERVHQIAQAGLKGLKMHPHYQDFFMDDPALDPLYEAIQSQGLLLTMHTGYDFAFEWIDRASPQQISTVISKFPDLKLVTTHLGGWQQWDAVEEFLIGKSIYMETSFSLQYLDHKKLKQMLLAHPADYLLFGTDSPWTDQGVEIDGFRNLGLSEMLLDKIFSRNARNLLESI
mgnify:CR=1 FL=1